MLLKFQFENQFNLEKLYQNILKKYILSNTQSEISDEHYISFCMSINYLSAFRKFEDSSIVEIKPYRGFASNQCSEVYPALIMDSSFIQNHSDLFYSTKKSRNYIFSSVILDQNNFLDKLSELFSTNSKTRHKEMHLQIHFSHSLFKNLVHASQQKFQINSSTFRTDFLKFLVDHKIVTSVAAEKKLDTDIEALVFISILFFRALPTPNKTVDSNGFFLDFLNPHLSFFLQHKYLDNNAITEPILNSYNLSNKIIVEYGIETLLEKKSPQLNHLLPFINFNTLTNLDSTKNHYSLILKSIKNGVNSALPKLSDVEQQQYLKEILQPVPIKLTNNSNLVHEFHNYLLILKEIYSQEFFDKTSFLFTKIALGLNKTFAPLVQDLYTDEEIRSKENILAPIFPSLFQPTFSLNDIFDEKPIQAKLFSIDINFLYSFINTELSPPRISQVFQNNLLKIYHHLNFRTNIQSKKDETPSVEVHEKFNFNLSFIFDTETEFTQKQFFKFALKYLILNYPDSLLKEEGLRELFLEYQMSLLEADTSLKNKTTKQKI